VGQKIDLTHQLVIYAADVNLLGYNIGTIKGNTETLMDASKEVDLEISADKTKYMLLPRHQNALPSHSIKIANGSFENVTQFRYF
jgi:hypothetical protein